MSEMQTFHVSINRGPEQVIQVRTGQYNLAAMAALAMLEYEEEDEETDIVKIWVPELMPQYGPYFYYYDGHKMGTLTAHLNPNIIW